MFTFIVVLSIVIQVFTALFVLEKNKKNYTNIFFFFMSVSVAAWAVINYMITRDPFSSAQLTEYRYLMCTVVIQNTFFLLFAVTYPNLKLKPDRTRAALYLGLTALAMGATLSPLVFSAVKYGTTGARPVTGPGMLIFAAHAAISVFIGLQTLRRRYSHERGQHKQQVKLIFIASTILWVIVPLTNFGITLATQTLFFAKISPLYTLAFSSIIAYAIVVQKLFDIRAAVARSVGYVMVVIFITVVYGSILFGVIDVVFQGPSHQLLRQILSIIFITPLALMFQRTKYFFDRVTSRLFYRDVYDSQDVIDRIGRVVSTEIELNRILKATRDILQTALKTSFVEFVLIKNGKYYFETHSSTFGGQNMLALGKMVEEQRKALLIADEMTSMLHIREKLQENGVAVSLRLKTQQQVVGYILFADKRSGEIYSRQDIKLLKIVGNQLSVSMQNALRFEEIQNFNLTLQAKVDEATHKLRQSNEKLKQMDEAKDDFISMASHQLRTPLTSVKGYISMVLEEDAGKITPTQRDMLGQAFFSSQRMVYLIADLLNVSRLKTGRFIMEPSKINLANMIEQEMRQLEETAASHNLTLRFDKPASFPDALLDETKTRQVIMNFIDNAIYYTLAGGRIRVSLAETASTIEMRVEDDGIGVPKAEQAHLFTKFYRAGNARHARPDGTGLGLFMAKKVIVGQGGSLLFESVEGKGSMFGFVFSKTAAGIAPRVQDLEVATHSEKVISKR